MSGQPHHETPGSGARRPRRDDRAAAHGSGRRRGTGFDTHRWFEEYRASHDGADPSDPLAGVPFN